MSTLQITESKQYVVVEQDDSSQSIEILNQNIGVIEVGIQGPPGINGNALGADKYYTQAFNSTSTVNVQHNLGKYPSVTVFDSADDEVEGDVSYTDLNNLTIQFSAPFSGTVTLN